MKNFLQSIGFEPIILHEQNDKGLTIIEKFEYYASKCVFAFILLTPDDPIHDSLGADEIYWRARQNVILELGWFMAKLGRERVAVLHMGKVDIPSDMIGVIYIPFRESILEGSEPIRQRLKGVNLI